MRCGRQTFSPDEWLAYLDGAESRKVLSHLAGCEVCRASASRLASVTAKLEVSGAAISETTDSFAAARIWDGLRFRMRKLGGSLATPLLGIEKIRSFLIPIVGPHSADDMLRVARTAPKLESDPEFEDSLGEMVQVLCGDQAAKFVRKAVGRRAA